MVEFLINLNLNWMGKLIKVLIKETGGEFTCGTLDDKKLVKSIKSKIQVKFCPSSVFRRMQ